MLRVCLSVLPFRVLLCQFDACLLTLACLLALSPSTRCCFCLSVGNRISLISKKNIRYEGTLYSINEANATVALQNVRSYGTEGREKTEPDTSFVAPQDAVHPYLLFRGQDIKDLHVHEASTEKPTADDPAIVSAGAPPPADLPAPPPSPQQPKSSAPAAAAQAPPQAWGKKPGSEKKAWSKPPQQQQQPKPPQQQQQQTQGGRGGQNRSRPRKPNNNPVSQVGTGASLLNRKARGTVEGGKSIMPGSEILRVHYHELT
jgi:protein LSM14